MKSLKWSIHEKLKSLIYYETTHSELKISSNLALLKSVLASRVRKYQKLNYNKH